MIARFVFGVALCLLLSPLVPRSAEAGEIPSCGEPGVVQSVAHRFERYNREFIGQNLAIAEFGRVRQSRYLSTEKTHQVERRFCATRVTTTDGRKRDLWYLIEGHFGFAGLGHSVEFCSTGLDPWFVYGAYCKSLR